MTFNSSKNKSTVFTLDTYTHNTSTYSHSLFQKDQKDVTHQNFSSILEYFLSLSQEDKTLKKNNKILLLSGLMQVFANDIFINYWEIIKIRFFHQSSINTVKNSLYLVFIFDWDDTFLFTTYLKGKKKIEQFDQQIKKQLKQLENIVCRLLDQAIKKGYVFIISNAESGWIQYSSKAYLPDVHAAFNLSKKIMLISARDLFQKQYPNNFKMWKLQTFKRLKLYFKRTILTNVICVGDREDDLEACKVLADDFDLIYIKKIKLQEKPTPTELIKELKALEKKFQQIIYAFANTTIKLEKRILSPENIRNYSNEESAPQDKPFQKQKK